MILLYPYYQVFDLNIFGLVPEVYSPDADKNIIQMIGF